MKNLIYTFFLLQIFQVTASAEVLVECVAGSRGYVKVERKVVNGECKHIWTARSNTASLLLDIPVVGTSSIVDNSVPDYLKEVRFEGSDCNSETPFTAYIKYDGESHKLELDDYGVAGRYGQAYRLIMSTYVHERAWISQGVHVFPVCEPEGVLPN